MCKDREELCACYNIISFCTDLSTEVEEIIIITVKRNLYLYFTYSLYQTFLDPLNPKNKAQCSSETSANTDQSTRRNIPEDFNF